MSEKKAFVDSLSDFVDKDFEFHLSGGEPLLSLDIYELITHISKYGFKTNMVTNGWLCDENVLLKLQEAGLSSLTFSLDGITAVAHDYLRGQKGSYAKIMQAVNAAKVKTPDLAVSIITLINAHNLDEIIPLVDFVEANKVLQMISFQVITQPFSKSRDDRWFKREDGLILWPRDKEQIDYVLTELYKRRLNGWKIGNQASHFLAFKKYFQNPNKFLKRVKCSMGDYEFHVDPYGKAFFCCFTEPIGNIKEKSLPELWVAPQTKRIREEVYKCKKNCHIMINCFFEDEKCTLK